MDVTAMNRDASVLIFIVGMAVHFCRPEIFKKYRYMEYAHGFWIVYWLGLSLLYTLLPDGADLRLVLFSGDLQSIAALGFFIAYLSKEGEGVMIGSLVLNLSFALGVLLLWNLGFAGQEQRWLAASELTSAASVGLMGWVFLKRYHTPAIPFALISMLYITLQRPGYCQIFLKLPTCPPDPKWLGALAVGKLLLGSVFYTIFFLPAKTYEPIKITKLLDHVHNEAGRKAVGWVGTILLGVVLHFGSTLFSQWLESRFPIAMSTTTQPNNSQH